MTENGSIYESLRDLIAQINPDQSNADWGRAFAALVWETGDEELIIYVLSDAGEKYRSTELTRLRGKSAKAAFKVARSTNGHRAEAIAEQLSMPIVVPGMPPLEMRQATHYFLRDACIAAERQIKGMVRNLRFWQRARDVSEPWPEEPIGTLIQDGAITPEMLVIDERETVAN